jgi:hypothetical protein
LEAELTGRARAAPGVIISARIRAWRNMAETSRKLRRDNALARPLFKLNRRRRLPKAPLSAGLVHSRIAILLRIVGLTVLTGHTLKMAGAGAGVETTV